MFAHQIGIELIARFRRGFNQARPTLDEAQKMAVARVAWVRQQQFFFGIDEQSRQQQQSPRATRRDHNAGRRNVQAVLLLIPSGDGLAQLGYAQGLGIGGFARLQGLLGRSHDGRGSGEIGLAYLHVDDVTTCGL